MSSLGLLIIILSHLSFVENILYSYCIYAHELLGPSVLVYIKLS